MVLSDQILRELSVQAGDGLIQEKVLEVLRDAWFNQIYETLRWGGEDLQ